MLMYLYLNLKTMQTVFTKGTTKQFKINSLVYNERVKLSISNAQPLFGQLVCLSDCEDLRKKEMVRFVSDKKLEWFEADNRNPVYTRIIDINLIEIIETL